MEQKTTILIGDRGKKSLRAVLIRAIAGGGFVSLLAVGAAFLAEVVLARVLGKQHYGVYVYATTIAGMLLLVARLGQDMALLRFVSTYVVKGEWQLLRGLLRFTQLSVVFLGALLCAIVVVVAIAGYILNEGGELQSTLLIAALMVPISALGYVYQFANRAFKRVVLALLPLNVLAPLLLAAIVLVADSVPGVALDARHAAGANAVAVVAAVLSALTFYRHVRPMPIQSATPQYNIREWLGVAVTMFFISGTYQITSQTDTVMLGAMINTDTAGLYNVATRVAMIAAFPLFVTNIIGAPMISELYASGKTEDLQRMLRSIVRITAMATLGIALVLLVSGSWILLLFGGDFTAGYPALLLLVMGQLFNTLSGASGHLLTQTGHHRAAAAIMASAALINVLLNFLLIPMFGMVGAALATTFSLICWNVGMVIYARRSLGLDPSILSVLKQK